MNRPVPGKIVCVGRNYAGHARELGNELPAQPMLFFKPSTALIGPDEAIVLPAASANVHYEAEIALVVGRRARRVAARDAIDILAGVACANDVSARDLQKLDGQWGRAKGFDTFLPLGPTITEGIDWDRLEIVGRLNGEVRQHGQVGDMVFPIPVLIEFITGVMTLEPGDVILTGTPDGVGPLAEGDVYEVEIPGLSSISNPVRSETA
ncbi:MAG TPA: fumarylacetoacetate hydrolase family protein [Gemmatimonadales bacterium]|nr:fumarylacetoacetate hydrolase family protein [Gemmatimonadales bacterium]